MTPSGPENLILVLGWACNSSCVFCIRNSIKRSHVGKRPNLDIEDYARAIIRYKRSLLGVTLSSFGETTMHPDFDSFVALSSRLSYMHVITNGSRPESVRDVLKSPGCLTISIDAPNADVYERLRKGLRFRDIVGTLSGAVSGVRHPGRSVGINMAVFNNTVGLIEDMAAFAASHGADYLNVIAGMGTEGAEYTGGPLDPSSGVVREKVERAKRSFPQLTVVTNTLDMGERTICQAPWTSLDIDPSGHAHPCCQSYEVDLGHWIKDDPWNSPALNRLREQMGNRSIDPTEFPSCAACRFRPGLS